MRPLARIGRLSAAFLGSNLARGAVAFALSLVIGRTLGVERFGRWVLCTTWASMLTVVADLGFGVLLPRDGARSDACHGRLLGGALASRLLLLVPLGAVMYAAAPRIAADPESIAGIRLGVLLGASGAAYGCFGALFRSQPAWVPTVLIVETAWSAVQLAASWVLAPASRRSSCWRRSFNSHRSDRVSCFTRWPSALAIRFVVRRGPKPRR